MEWCGVFMMGLWASGLRSLRPLASTHSVPRLTTPSFSPHINPFRKNSKLKQNILWFGLSFVQISCRKIRSFPFLVDFHSFLPKRARKYHLMISGNEISNPILKTPHFSFSPCLPQVYYRIQDEKKKEYESAMKRWQEHNPVLALEGRWLFPTHCSE